MDGTTQEHGHFAFLILERGQREFFRQLFQQHITFISYRVRLPVGIGFHLLNGAIELSNLPHQAVGLLQLVMQYGIDVAAEIFEAGVEDVKRICTVCPWVCTTVRSGYLGLLASSWKA
jgi:hypothetical protein